MKGYTIKYKQLKLQIIIDSNFIFNLYIKKSENKNKYLIMIKDNVFLHNAVKSLA